MSKTQDDLPITGQPAEPYVTLGAPQLARDSDGISVLISLAQSSAATLQIPRPVRQSAAVRSAIESRIPSRQNSMRKRVSIGYWPLLAILGLQALASIRLIWTNSAFPDEALYLWSGHLEWSSWLYHTSIPDFQTYFSGAPVVYPPLGALVDTYGGLTAARLLSLGFMLIASYLLYLSTRRIFSHEAAIFATGLFAATAATEFLGAFATYDAMAVALLALATWLGVRASTTKRVPVEFLLLLLSALALSLADAAKYAATLWDPVVLSVAVLTAWKERGGKNAAWSSGLLISGLTGILVTALIQGGHAYWRGIGFTTLARAHGTSSAFGILSVSAGWVGVVAFLTFVGIAVVFVRYSALPVRLIAICLSGAVTLAPAEQARIHVFTSLFKHVGFGAWFAASVAGYGLASLTEAVPPIKARSALLASAGMVVISAAIALPLAQTHFSEWPNTRAFIGVMSKIMKTASKGPVLAADNGNEIEYYLPNEANVRVFYGPWFFRYQDPQSGNYLVDRPAYADAVKNRYFAIVALSFSDSAATDKAIMQDIDTYGGYRLVSVIPYRMPGRESAFRIWVREDS